MTSAPFGTRYATNNLVVRSYETTHAGAIFFCRCRHFHCPVPRVVFQNSLAQVAAREPIGLREITNSPANVRFGDVERLVAVDEAHVARGRRHDLHQADFAGEAGEVLIPIAFDAHDGTNEFG